MPVLFCNVIIFKGSKCSKIYHGLNSCSKSVLSVCCSWFMILLFFPQWKKISFSKNLCDGFLSWRFFYYLEIRIYSVVKMSADSCCADKQCGCIRSVVSLVSSMSAFVFHSFTGSFFPYFQLWIILTLSSQSSNADMRHHCATGILIKAEVSVIGSILRMNLGWLYL